MKIDVNKDYSQERWFVMKSGTTEQDGDPELLIRTYPTSKEEFIGRTDGSLVLTGKNLFDKFSYCLVNWKNIKDDKDQELPCNDDVKKIVYDNALGGIPVFVNECLQQIVEEREADRKNS